MFADVSENQAMKVFVFVERVGDHGLRPGGAEGVSLTRRTRHLDHDVACGAELRRVALRA